MPYVASPGTYVPSRIAVRAAHTPSVTAYAHGPETDPCVSRDYPREAQISLVHNVFRSTAVSAVSAGATGEGATYGTG